MLVIGTVVLVLGVVFFVKYAFDNRWLTEAARVAIGTLAGLAAWAGGLRLARAGYPVYGRMLAGGGLAMIYLTAYAEQALYGLVSPAVAFVWMAGVSACTTVTADRQRSIGLALIAIVLAYCAPALVGRDGHHLVFFAYSLSLAGLTLALTRRHGWPTLGFTSLYLSLLLTSGWAARSYRQDLYASTELYFVLVFGVFIAVVRTLRDRPASPGTLVPLAAKALLVILPVVFHLASVAVLFDHSVPLLAYLIVITAVALGVPALRASATVRLALWFLVAAPFYSWLLVHRTGPWYVAALAAAVGVYVLHLLAQFLTMSETARPATVEIVLFHANSLSLFLFLYVLVDANAGSTAVMAATLAGWHAALAWGARTRLAEGTPHALALAFALAATAVALAFVGPWVTVGWAAEGLAVLYVGLFMRRPFLRAGGWTLLAIAAARLMVHQFPVTLISHRPVLNARVATTAFVVAAFYVVAALYRRTDAVAPVERTHAARGATIAAHGLTILLVTAEIQSFWELREQALTIAFARQLSLSLAWAAYALGLILVGFARRSPLLRYVALALFGLTVLKMFAIDLLELAGLYRIAGFVALGLMLLVASFFYQRSVAKHGTA